MNVWQGCIYLAGIETVDGRSIDRHALTFEPHRPVMTDDNTVIGHIDRLIEFESIGIAWGHIDLPPGRYNVGIDVGAVVASLDDGFSEAIHYGEVLGMHIVEGSAWPLTTIMVHGG